MSENVTLVQQLRAEADYLQKWFGKGYSNSQRLHRLAADVLEAAGLDQQGDPQVTQERR